MGFLDGVASRIKGLPIEIDGGHRVSGSEFRPFPLSYAFSEFAATQQDTGFPGPLILLPWEDELPIGNAGHQGYGGIVVRSGFEKLGVGREGGDLPKSGSFEMG